MSSSSKNNDVPILDTSRLFLRELRDSDLWLIGRESWGQGFATEGARALLDLALPRYGQAHVISLIQPENLASIRVAEKIGEALEGETDLNGTRVLVYGVELDR